MWFAVIVPLQFVGVGGTQILFKKQEDSLCSKARSVCVIPFPLFTSSSEQISISFPLLSFFFFFLNLVQLAVERPKEYHCRGGGGGSRTWRRMVEEGEEREEKSTTGRPLKNKKIK